MFRCQDGTSLQSDDMGDDDGIVPQRRAQVSQDQEDLVVKGEDDIIKWWPVIMDNREKYILNHVIHSKSFQDLV